MRARQDAMDRELRPSQDAPNSDGIAALLTLAGTLWLGYWDYMDIQHTAQQLRMANDGFLGALTTAVGVNTSTEGVIPNAVATMVVLNILRLSSAAGIAKHLIFISGKGSIAPAAMTLPLGIYAWVRLRPFRVGMKASDGP